jgi:N-acetylmuramoyl-L-alanine amidase
LPDAVLRFLLSAGHGLNNVSVGSFDCGASSPYGSEHAIVLEIAQEVFEEFYSDDSLEFSVDPVPQCSTACGEQHENTGHLQQVIKHINEHCAKFDIALQLHMNASDNAKASGVEVYYAAGAPAKRRRQAEVMAKTLSQVLGLPNRGAKPDTASARKRLAFLRETKCPALLVELAFVTNPADVDAVRTCGADAMIAAMHAVRGVD